MFSLVDHTIFLALAGSQAHGTAREGSDIDLRGVCVAPTSVRRSLFQSFEQYEGELPAELMEAARPQLEAHRTAHAALEVKVECAIFELAKFMKLCAAANPNMLETLFADERDWVLETRAWRRLHDAREMFLTQKAHQTFHGYASAQLGRIKRHRGWLIDPPKSKPTRREFGVAEANGLSRDDQNRIEQSIAQKVRSYGIDDLEMPKAARIELQARLDRLMRDALLSPEADDGLDERLREVATGALRLPSGVVEQLSAEKRYRGALQQWRAYESWKQHRNPARAELEARFGYDTKHAMHLVRLMKMGIEILEHGTLRVRRSDAVELLAIRDGALTYGELLESAAALEQSIQRAAAHTTLPPDIEPSAVDELYAEVLSLATESSREGLHDKDC